MNDKGERMDGRDSVFLVAALRLESGEYQAKVWNLSSGGAMIEGGTNVSNGGAVSVNIRNIGWVDGVIVWVAENRCGIAFNEPIDPKAARLPISGGGVSAIITGPAAIRTRRL